MTNDKINTLDAFLIALDYAPDKEAIEILCKSTTREVLQEFVEYMKAGVL